MSVLMININSDFEEFAKGLAELARKHNISKAHVTIDHRLENQLFVESGYSNKASVFYKQTDGRGRPEETLRLNFDAQMHVDIELEIKEQ